MITRLLCSWGFSRQEYWGGLPCPPPGDLPNPGIKPRSPALQVDSLLSEQADFFIVWATREARESLLQGNFLTQELNQSLLHCRQILYQLSYEESLSLLGTSSQLQVIDNCSFSWQMLLFFFFCTLVSGGGKPDWQLPIKPAKMGVEEKRVEEQPRSHHSLQSTLLLCWGWEGIEALLEWAPKDIPITTMACSCLFHYFPFSEPSPPLPRIF